MMEAKPSCPKCGGDMQDHLQIIHQIGKVYPALKCPKCGAVMLHESTAQQVTKDIYDEHPINWPEVRRILARAEAAGEDFTPPFDSGGFAWRVREASKYLSRDENSCPRCGSTNIKLLKERKIGKEMGCAACNTQYFYEYPEEKKE
jgi:uncharacterized Zn finger protein